MPFTDIILSPGRNTFVAALLLCSFVTNIPWKYKDYVLQYNDASISHFADNESDLC